MPVVLSAAGADPPGYLIMIELTGGNDALNAFVPLDQTAYYNLRPKLALRDKAIAELRPNLGLNTALAPLLPAWREGEMAVLPGLGYSAPNLSHFRGMDIWYSGSGSREYVASGWLSAKHSDGAPADGLTLARGNSLFRGGKADYLTINNLEKFVINGGDIHVWQGTPSDENMAFLINTGREVKAFQQLLSASLAGTGAPQVAFSAHAFGRQCYSAARLIAGQIGVPMLHLRLGGFDTHARQLARHNRQLKVLAEGLASLRSALIQNGNWQNTLIATFSEFGRRAAENASGGTDHGTAATHFVMGGSVKGGVYGDYPSLSDLDNRGNLRYTTDFRRLYSTIEHDWLGRDRALFSLNDFPRLPFIRTTGRLHSAARSSSA